MGDGFSYNLLLDDERCPQDITWLELPAVELPAVEWTIVRTFNEFTQYIKKYGLPKIISFDHDLSWPEHYEEFFECRRLGRPFNYNDMKEKTGYCAAKWLCG